MRKLILFVLLLNTCVISSTQTTYFQKDVLSGSSDSILTAWYPKIFQEPSLLELSKNPTTESYRFLWLRTFNRLIVIRLDIQTDGTGVLIMKIANGHGGYPDTSRKLIRNDSKKLTREQVQTFLQKIAQVNFWSIPTNAEKDQPGANGAVSTSVDGACWIIEAVKHGEYHGVIRWDPLEYKNSKDKKAISDIGLALPFDLAGLKISGDELY